MVCEHGFHSMSAAAQHVWLCRQKESKVGYTSAEYFAFYQKSLQYIVDINKAGYYPDEVTASWH